MKNAQKLSAKIAEAFATSMESTREAAKDIGFHMTDWDSDVDELIALYEDPDAFSNDQIVDIVIRFLAHVPNHVAAAKKLVGLGPMEDIFEVGILIEDAD
jgi:hypothetical protein